MDIANLVVSAADQAVYARMIERHGQRSLVLATTDLRTGRTTLGEPASVPLLDLAGTDSRGRVYARTPDGVAALDPAGRTLWRLRPQGAVTVREKEHLVIAYGDDPGRLTLVGYDAAGAPRRTSSVRLDPAVTENRTVRLVAVEEGDRFVFHVAMRERLPGRLITTTADGRLLADVDDPDAVARTLPAIESRIDLAMSAVTPEGAVLIPFSDVGGYRILRLEPS
ncbi:hypothetical protein OG417_26615 [Actinoallomurus sp. NBC_01490]|uniref:hypothetical protein n=1 Tax=Actinoallomurus sp. NBC_01490 TaxID=2903557 RepID=UPI002E348CFE|nr:hypothetical protein [Actinoallomurus sp. NBC_01490]